MVRKLILLAGCTMLLASLFGCSATVASYPDGYYSSGYYPRSNVYIYRASPHPYPPYRPYHPYGPYRPGPPHPPPFRR